MDVPAARRASRRGVAAALGSPTWRSAGGYAVMRYNQRQRRLMHSGRMPIAPRASARTSPPSISHRACSMERCELWESCPVLHLRDRLAGHRGSPGGGIGGRLASASASAPAGLRPRVRLSAPRPRENQPVRFLRSSVRRTDYPGPSHTAPGCRAVGEDGLAMRSHRRRGLGNDHVIPMDGIRARHEA